MLRKRGQDSGPRASWAFSFGAFSGNSEEDNDYIPAIKAAAIEVESAPRENNLEVHGSPTATELDATLDLTASPEPSEGAGGMLDAMDVAVDAAATQLVSKALRFMSLESSPPPAKSRGRTASPVPRNSPLIKFDSTSFLDKGLDAINGMGKLVEGFAVTLDSVIGQAFEDWGTPNVPGREGKKKVVKLIGVLAPQEEGNRQAAADKSTRRKGGTNTQKSREKDAWGDFDLDDQGNITLLQKSSSQQSPLAAASSAATKSPGAPAASPAPPSLVKTTQGGTAKEIQQWRRRAQILQRELQKLRVQRDEYHKLKEEYEALQTGLTTQHSGTAAEETTPQRSSARGGLASTQSAAPSPDPLATEQMTRQMEALLVEKARLAQENDRLLRENSGLHELLEFTMQQHVANLGDDELFGDEGELEEEEESRCGAAAGVEEETSFESANESV